ncbi:MAG: SpoIID/LytB domain-containing protein [Bacteroidota bacterium]
MAACLRLAFLLAITASMVEAQVAPEAVRVRLSTGAASAATVASAGAPLRVDGLGTVRAAVRLGVRGGEVEAASEGRTHRAPTLVIAGAGVSVRAGGTERTYLGSLSVRAVRGRLEIVNVVPVEDYVASVVASEYPFTEPAGIEAQAVLARTYALRRAGSRRTYDVDDHTGSQVYRGEGVVTARARRAALATAGEVLTYGGDLAEAPYFSSSGGHTANNEAVWRGAPLPYLRGVPDPTDADSPHHRWTASVPRDVVHQALSRHLGRRVTRLEIGQQSPNGRVVTVRLGGGGTASGGDVRTAVNAVRGARTIRSTHFRIRSDGGRYVFEGRGFGHGVGMSQYGARGLARQGLSHRAILAHYFRGTSIARLGAPRYATDRPEPEVGEPARARTWPVPRRVAREAEREAERRAATAPRRRAW